jgi:transcriptional regulator with XRE-family HTH domain
MRKTLHSPEYARLIALLIEARHKAGLVQQALADKISEPQSFVAKIERGERRVDVVEFVAIAEALGHDPVELLRRFVRTQSRRG